MSDLCLLSTSAETRAEAKHVLNCLTYKLFKILRELDTIGV